MIFNRSASRLATAPTRSKTSSPSARTPVQFFTPQKTCKKHQNSSKARKISSKIMFFVSIFVLEKIADRAVSDGAINKGFRYTTTKKLPKKDKYDFSFFLHLQIWTKFLFQTFKSCQKQLPRTFFSCSLICSSNFVNLGTPSSSTP
jgi:hypothetical protein